jgi:hypothetical protein
MTDRQMVDVGVTLLDQDKQPLTELPEGTSVLFTSDNEDVVSVEVHDDGMNATLRSGKVGTASVTVHASGPLVNFPDDVIAVTVKNSQPNALNTTIGIPSDEPDEE